MHQDMTEQAASVVRRQGVLNAWVAKVHVGLGLRFTLLWGTKVLGSTIFHLSCAL